MRQLLLGILIGSVLMTVTVGAADYLHSSGGDYTKEQATLGEIRVRETLETIQMMRQNYLDQQVHDAGKVPCN